MKFGFSTLGCPNYTADQVIALAKDNGFDGVELRFLEGTVDLPSLSTFSADGLIDLRKRFEDAGVAVACIDTSVRMTSLDPDARAQQFEDARAHAKIGEALGAKYLRVFGGPIPKEQDMEQSLDAIAQGLREVADMTQEFGVTSLLETHDEFCQSPAILDLYSRGVSENLGILWDTLHTYRHGETAQYSWEQLGSRTKIVHVKDANIATPSGFDFALTGEGTVPILSFIEVLKAAEFDGWVNFEWEKGWHPEIQEPEIAIPHFAAYLSQNGVM